MSITDELRKWAHDEMPRNYRMAVLALADHIDEEHEKAVHELNGLAEASVLLPKDADGEVVRVGSLCKVYPFNEPAKKVRALRVSGFGWFVTFEDGTEEQLYRIRVYKPPTTEDVLCEMLEKAVGYSDAHTTVALSAIAEYANRLQLKEDA